MASINNNEQHTNGTSHRSGTHMNYTSCQYVQYNIACMLNVCGHDKPTRHWEIYLLFNVNFVCAYIEYYLYVCVCTCQYSGTTNTITNGNTSVNGHSHNHTATKAPCSNGTERHTKHMSAILYGHGYVYNKCQSLPNVCVNMCMWSHVCLCLFTCIRV